ncbi:MAG TPA: protein YgfX [Burkholderiales bacterium]|nr:protein YgfX [Burkholderiales bacterium]
MSGSQALRFEFSPSPVLAAGIVALHACAAVSVAIALPGAGGFLLAAALLALGLAAAWSRALLRSAASVRALELDASGATLELAGGRRLAAEFAARRYVGRFLVTLCVRRPMRRTLLVTADMLKGGGFRRLRIWALWGKLPAVAAKQLRT